MMLLRCCNQGFAVQEMKWLLDGYVLSRNLDSQVGFCPFCGRNLTLIDVAAQCETDAVSNEPQRS